MISIEFNTNTNTNKEQNRSIVALPDDFTAVDIETTGLMIDFCEIIEIAAVKVRNNEIVDTFETLIKPQEPIPDYIEQLTGISNELVKNAPNCSEAIRNFFDFIQNDLLIGHNFSFDMSFLKFYARKENLEIENSFTDTYRLFRKLHPELPHHRLQEMTAFYDVKNTKAHRALSDTLSTLTCYQKLKEEALNKYETEENFILQFKKKRHEIDIKSITPDAQDLDETNPLFDKEVVFTGTLTGMDRADAMQHVVNIGGRVAKSITKKTNFLVIGASDIEKIQKNGPTSKMKKAEDMQSKGFDISVMSESTFF